MIKRKNNADTLPTTNTKRAACGDEEKYRKPSTNPTFYLAMQDKRLTIGKGNMKQNVPFILWESIPSCDMTACPTAEICPYTHEGDGKKCAVQLKYIKRVYNYIVTRLKDDVDEVRMMDIGLSLMPLYGHLIKLKLIEAGLGHAMCETVKGKSCIHPVYKEIRSVMAEIRHLQKDILRSDAPVASKELAVTDLMNGDAEWVDSLVASTQLPRDGALRKELGLPSKVN